LFNFHDKILARRVLYLPAYTERH